MKLLCIIMKMQMQCFYNVATLKPTLVNDFKMKYNKSALTNLIV